MIKLFNGYHIMFLSIMLAAVIALYFILRKKSKKTISIVLFSILMFAFALHCSKLLFEPYRSKWPYSIKDWTPISICALSTIIFPWIFLSKNKGLKDYMFYIGVLSGVLASILPVDAIGRSAGSFDGIRFFIGHGIILAVPLLMVVFKLHTLSYKRTPKVVFWLFLVLVVILVNEVFLAAIGITDPKTMSEFLSNNSRNGAYIFGPNKDLKAMNNLFLVFTPKFLTTVPFGANAGAQLYWPILWLVIPSIIYITSLCFLISLIFDHKNFKEDFKALKTKIKQKFNKGSETAPTAAIAENEENLNLTEESNNSEAPL